jgi:AraC-like DNA-binding protein
VPPEDGGIGTPGTPEEARFNPFRVFLAGIGLAMGGFEPSWRTDAMESSESRLLDRLLPLAEANLGNPRFTVDELAAGLYLSRRQLLRRTSAFGFKPGDLLRRLRLELAAVLLRRGASVKKAAAATGFRSPSHFCLAFRAAFGATPSRFQGSRTGKTDYGAAAPKSSPSAAARSRPTSVLSWLPANLSEPGP